jgi:hypothetical protein
MSKFTAALLVLMKLTVFVCVGFLCISMIPTLLLLITPRLPISYLLLNIFDDSELAEFMFRERQGHIYSGISPQDYYYDPTT